MTIIYVVFSDKSDEGISGVFSTEGRARESIEVMSLSIRNNYWIESWTLDEQEHDSSS